MPVPGSLTSAGRVHRVINTTGIIEAVGTARALGDCERQCIPTGLRPLVKSMWPSVAVRQPIGKSEPAPHPLPVDVTRAGHTAFATMRDISTQNASAAHAAPGAPHGARYARGIYHRRFAGYHWRPEKSFVKSGHKNLPADRLKASRNRRCLRTAMPIFPLGRAGILCLGCTLLL